MYHKRKMTFDNNELVKAVAETFSIKICFAFSLNTLNCMNGVPNMFVMLS